MSAKNKLLILGMSCLISAPLFSQNVYLELNLNNQSVHERIRSPRSKSQLELFRVIDRASKDKRIGGIILNMSGFSAGQEFLWELRSALQEFKSHNKKICAFISAANLDLYCLASVADKIVMDEQGVLNMTGYVWGRGYVQHSLEKLGIGIRELRYLEFKSASEMFTRDSISDADRIQYGEWLDDIYMVTKETITKARSLSSEEFDDLINKDFLYSPKSAHNKGLVDRLGREEAIIETLKEIEGADVKYFVHYGDNRSSLVDSKTHYGPAKAGGLFSTPPVIAVVYANGQTDMEQGMAARNLAKIIRKISERRRVKAIVVRIDSPGGSAEAADYIAEAIKFAQKKIPVVVSMGSVAASGGYWAAIYANQIIASPYTLTGSIGVIGSWIYDNGLNTKLGFTVDVMQRGEHADLGSGFILPRRDLNQIEEERYKEYLMDMYGDFTAKVATGRKMDIDQVESVAQGRVFSGLGALNAGLIDSIGGLADAVSIAKKLAEIPENKKVAYNEFPKPTFWDKLILRMPMTSVNVNNNFSAASGLLLDLFLPAQVTEDILYRILHNGQVMPILPVDFTAR